MALRHADALTPAHCPDCCGRAPPRLCTVRRSLPTSSCPSTGCRRVRDCDDRPPERGGLAEASPLNNRHCRQPSLASDTTAVAVVRKACPSCGRSSRHGRFPPSRSVSASPAMALVDALGGSPGKKTTLRRNQAIRDVSPPRCNIGRADSAGSQADFGPASDRPADGAS